MRRDTPPPFPTSLHDTSGGPVPLAVRLIISVALTVLLATAVWIVSIAL
jgi:hypothetical protein